MDKKKLIENTIENLDGECSLAKLRKMGNLYSGSKPLRTSFQEMKELGIQKIIDLKLPAETPIDEKALAQAAGLEYINIPINGADTYTKEVVEKISAEVDNNIPTLVYCASANRVPAWLCMSLGLENILSEEENIEIGKKMGMDKAPTFESVQNFLNNLE